ncbi:MAG TPA: TraR/DksA C4-type zinc finger protein [Candidatus Binatia bacterium]
MNATVVKRCEENLLKRRREILPYVKHIKEETGDAAGMSPFSRRDLAENISAEFLARRFSALFERELEDIDITLGRIRTGTFGICRACHQPIEAARLERFPQAEFCSDCKDTKESFRRAS